MPRTENANRARTARRIIKTAYGITAKSSSPRVIRFELIGSSVAIVLLAGDGDLQRLPTVKVARELAGGKVEPLPDDSRSDFAEYTDVVAHVEKLYARYGVEGAGADAGG